MQSRRVMPEKAKGGMVLYRGPSRIDGSPIVAIATFKTDNVKTGDMVQVWILADSGEKPTDAIKSDGDASVCGSCVHRGIGGGKGRSCYVNAGQGPNALYRSYLNHQYVDSTESSIQKRFRGRDVRIGAYGDPAAVPVDVWRRILRYSNGHTGYTHLWRSAENQEYRDILMASCDSVADRETAKSLGWRTFRIRLHDGDVIPGEVICPASPEGQYRRTCDECQACNGSPRPGKSDIVIIGHGGIGILPNLNRTLAALANA